MANHEVQVQQSSSNSLPSAKIGPMLVEDPGRHRRASLFGLTAQQPFFLPLRSRARGASFSICSAVLQASQETNDEVQTRYLPLAANKSQLLLA